MARTDIRIDASTNEPVIVNGDFGVDDSAEITDARLIMQTNPGDWKEDGSIGLGLPSRINGDETPAQLIKIDKDIRQQLEYDGLVVTKIDTTQNPYTVQVNG